MQVPSLVRTKIPQTSAVQPKKSRVQKNVCVMFIAVGKKDRRIYENMYTHIYIYVHIYIYICLYHYVCKCIDMSGGVIQKGLAIVIASKAVVDGRPTFSRANLSHTVSIFYYMCKLLLL